MKDMLKEKKLIDRFKYLNLFIQTKIDNNEKTVCVYN